MADAPEGGSSSSSPEGVKVWVKDDLRLTGLRSGTGDERACLQSRQTREGRTWELVVGWARDGGDWDRGVEGVVVDAMLSGKRSGWEADEHALQNTRPHLVCFSNRAFERRKKISGFISKQLAVAEQHWVKRRGRRRRGGKDQRD